MEYILSSRPYINYNIFPEGFCTALRFSGCKVNISNLPELFNLRPKGVTCYDYWFEVYEKGTERRILILLTAICEVQSLINNNKNSVYMKYILLIPVYLLLVFYCLMMSLLYFSIYLWKFDAGQAADISTDIVIKIEKTKLFKWLNNKNLYS